MIDAYNETPARRRSLLKFTPEELVLASVSIAAAAALGVLLGWLFQS